MATWPKFSITSFKMVSALARQGILPRSLIDVGANVGQFAIAASMIYSGLEVHSFEPVPETIARLRQNVRAFPNIKVYPLALGAVQGCCSLHINSHSQSSSMLSLENSHLKAFPDEREVETIEVEVTTLDTVFAAVDLRPPTLLKLDVQGYEAQTLSGGPQTLTRCDYVVAEASFKPLYLGETLFNDLVSMMTQWGFEFLRPVGWLTDPRTREVLQIDALFGRSTASNGRVLLPRGATRAVNDSGE